eukprot:COSAG06_NODE_6929_length_2712_cov_1.758132_4_plen_61_part_00
MARGQGDMNDLKKYLPMAANVVEAFRQRFPNKDDNGKIDMWPAQVRKSNICNLFAMPLYP